MDWYVTGPLNSPSDRDLAAAHFKTLETAQKAHPEQGNIKAFNHHSALITYQEPA